MTFTHRHYFRSYKLSPAQYGEILVAAAVRGEKKGDSQPCYDVLANADSVRRLLKAANADASSPVWPVHEGEVRIQVRSKLTHTTAGGTASVVHCKESDFKQMTHLAVVLIHSGSLAGDPGLEGTITNAWLMTSRAAKELRQRPGATQYIQVNQLRNGPLPHDVVDITAALAREADLPIDPATAVVTAHHENDRIRKTPGVAGGSARIRDTRIPVWALWRMKELGRSDAQLLEDYPSLTQDDLSAAWAYVEANRQEVTESINRQGRSPTPRHPAKA